MVLERRGRVKWSHDRSNWKQEDLDACDRQAVRLACLLDGSRMSREVHVRFCERPVVQSRRLLTGDIEVGIMARLSNLKRVMARRRLASLPIREGDAVANNVQSRYDGQPSLIL